MEAKIVSIFSYKAFSSVFIHQHRHLLFSLKMSPAN